MSLRSIVAALGGELHDGGRRANVPAPGHSRRDRSVSLLLSSGRVVVHGFGAADWREVLDDLRARGLIDAAGAPASAAAAAEERWEPPLRAARAAAARALWADGSSVEAGSLSGRHLRLRGVAEPATGSEALRHHPSAPLSVYQPTRRTRPALLAALLALDGALTAVEVTYLGPDGRRASGLRLPRKTVGLVPPGSAVRLAEPGPELLVAEGVFTTLSAMARFGMPGWALLSTSNLRTWRAPDGVRRVLVAADGDRDGQRSASLLARRLREDGLTVRLRTPPPPFGDWNEAALAVGEEKEGRGRTRRTVGEVPQPARETPP